MTTRYVHTNIVAHDWRRLADFYCRVFECVALSPERELAGDWLARATGVPGAALQGVHLRLPGYGEDGPTLEIFTYHVLHESPPPLPNRVGLGHLAFAVDDVPATVTRLLAAGGSLFGEIVSHEVAAIGQLTFVYAADPEGNMIEIQRWSVSR